MQKLDSEIYSSGNFEKVNGNINTILHNQMIQDRHVSLLTQPPILRLNQQQWTTTNI